MHNHLHQPKRGTFGLVANNKPGAGEIVAELTFKPMTREQMAAATGTGGLGGSHARPVAGDIDIKVLTASGLPKASGLYAATHPQHTTQLLPSVPLHNALATGL